MLFVVVMSCLMNNFNVLFMMIGVGLVIFFMFLFFCIMCLMCVVRRFVFFLGGIVCDGCVM